MTAPTYAEMTGGFTASRLYPDLAANTGHSPPLIGETKQSTLADEQATVGANNKEQITSP
jgi:hypothetical protein